MALVGASLEVIEVGGAEGSSTNNRMELRAAIDCLKLCNAKAPNPEVIIFCDSKLVIQGATQWIHGWKKSNWKKSDGKDVMNQDLWLELDPYLQRFGKNLKWYYVAGHSGIEGNERVDEIAVSYSLKQELKLFQGQLKDYPGNGMFSESEVAGLVAGEFSKNNSTKKSSSKGGTYLSLVSGVLERHQTWAECEARVKGRSGAKYKKVKSDLEEAEVLRSWGLT